MCAFREVTKECLEWYNSAALTLEAGFPLMYKLIQVCFDV